MSDSEEEVKADDEAWREEAAAELLEQERALPTNRAIIRYNGGTAAWRANMYITSASKRAGNEEYNEQQLAHRRDLNKRGITDLSGRVLTNGEVYDMARAERRKQAREEAAKLGFYIKPGRPPLPPGIAAIPKKAIEPLSLDEMIILGEPKAFKNVDYQIKIPEHYVRVAVYLGVSVINVHQAPLKWGCFRFSTWDELKKATRNGYLGNARGALGGTVGYTNDPANADLVRRFLEYDAAADKYYLELEKDLVEEGGEGEADDVVIEVEDDVPPPPPRPEVKRKLSPEALAKREAKAAEKAAKKAAAPRKVIWTRNPIRIVEFMLAVNIDPFFIVQETCDQAYTVANARASALASVCYCYLRYLLKNKQEKGDVFRKVLNWSHIFERYTRVAKRITGDKHASQQTTAEKLENTVEWSLWQEKALQFIERYFVIKSGAVSLRTRKEGFEPWWPGHPQQMRLRKTVLENVEKEVVDLREKELLPWWRAEYAETEKDRSRPNLRELRDAVMAACYSLLAPIRLDWATVEVMDAAEFAKFRLEKKADDEQKARVEEGAPPAAVPKRRKKFNINILVVDNMANPTRADMAWFGQMKNIKSFKEQPVPKYIREESPLCEKIILAYLRERNAVGFQSACLFPYSTYKGEELRPAEAKGNKAMNCFNNNAFGERLADLAWDVVRKNFTETLMRRSYITWFWTNTDKNGVLVNNPLNTDVWNKLLPSVHQNSKDANLGYIKGVLEEYQQWLKANPKATVVERERVRRELSTKALTVEGAFGNTAQNADPEVDSDDRKEKQEVLEAIQVAKKEEQAKVAELRRSKRIAVKELPVIAPPAPAVKPLPAAPKAAEQPPAPAPPPKKAGVKAAAKEAAAAAQKAEDKAERKRKAAVAAKQQAEQQQKEAEEKAAAEKLEAEQQGLRRGGRERRGNQRYFR